MARDHDINAGANIGTSASQQEHENSYYTLDYYNLPKISNCIISPFLVYPEVKQTHESSQTRAI
ncbi:hypothetical protein V1478_008830 [Vespula squamosa]|uniref:Uncharacterized protein n=1 Tax=Vespula squamosa TaxID=30214 RepID=A0ABD2AUM1_VESSQ